jgi:hypothetical protein
MVKLIVGLPPVILIAPVVMLAHPGTGVEVEVGVNVIVAVKVMVGVRVSVKVGVIVGVSVGVVLGKGVNVIKSPPGCVAVGVSDGPVGIKVGVLEGTAVAGTVGAAVLVEPVVGTTLFPEFISRIPSIVRALEEVIVRELIGSRVTIGLYVAETSTTTRSGSSRVLT